MGGERYLHSEEFPAFKGHIEFDITLELVGHHVSRGFRAEYKHTPDWKYFDLIKMAPYVGWGGTTWHFLLLAIPADEDEEIPEDEWEDEDEDDDEEEDVPTPSGWA